MAEPQESQEKGFDFGGFANSLAKGVGKFAGEVVKAGEQVYDSTKEGFNSVGEAAKKDDQAGKKEEKAEESKEKPGFWARVSARIDAEKAKREAAEASKNQVFSEKKPSEEAAEAKEKPGFWARVSARIDAEKAKREATESNQKQASNEKSPVIERAEGLKEKPGFFERVDNRVAARKNEKVAETDSEKQASSTQAPSEVVSQISNTFSDIGKGISGFFGGGAESKEKVAEQPRPSQPIPPSFGMRQQVKPAESPKPAENESPNVVAQTANQVGATLEKGVENVFTFFKSLAAEKPEVQASSKDADVEGNKKGLGM